MWDCAAGGEWKTNFNQSMFGSNGNLTSLDYRWHWIHFWDWNHIYGNLLDYIHIERVWDESPFCFGNDLVFTEKFCERSKVPQTICSWLFIWVSDWVFEFNKTLGNGPRWDRRFGMEHHGPGQCPMDSQCMQCCIPSKDLKLGGGDCLCDFSSDTMCFHNREALTAIHAKLGQTLTNGPPFRLSCRVGTKTMVSHLDDFWTKNTCFLYKKNLMVGENPPP